MKLVMMRVIKNFGVSQAIFVTVALFQLIPRGVFASKNYDAFDCARLFVKGNPKHLQDNIVHLRAAGFDPDEVLLNIRNPFDPIKQMSVLQRYLKNYREMTEKVFKPAYRDGSIITNYEEVMRQLHRVLALGLDGNSRYNGNHPQRKFEEIEPGIFVFDQDYLEGLMTGVIASPGAQIAFFSVTSMALVNEVTAAFPLEFLKGRPDRYFIEVEEIPKEDWPLNWAEMISTSGLRPEIKSYYHDYPVLPFLKEMSGRRLYFELSKELMGGIFKAKTDEYRLTLLADYYHVAINGHFYVAGNNSVFMGIVNALLEMNGYRALPHEILDYKALTMSTREFRIVFKSLVKKI